MFVLQANPTILHRVAVVELFGTIGGQIKSNQYEHIFTNIAKNDRMRALVLDIDSPGGGVSASDYLYRSVLKVAERKPVIACIRGLGASGAYYISCAANKIIATPGAIIGSIGVISVRPALQELLERIGVGVVVNKSGPYKDMGAFWREATDEEQGKMQELIDESYDTFVSIVAKGRNMDEAKVREVATGEVFWATKAKELDLIDELGDLEMAIEMAADMAGAPPKPVFIRPRRGLRQMLMNPASALVESLADEIETRIRLGFTRY